MLKRLSVSNYVLIGSLDIDFPEGLVIISGETGAGKSLLLGALALALGGKSDSAMVGSSSDTCVVEAEFSISPALKERLREKDLPFEENGITLRRVVSRSGRSRCFICDEPVSMADVQELSSHLVDIHSQHQTLRLGDPAFRMDVLDLYADAMPSRENCRKAWEAVKSISAELESTRKAIQQSLLEEDYNRSLLQRLEDAHLVPGELEDLDAEQRQLAHAEEILELLNGVLESLGNEEYSVASRLRDGVRGLEKASAHMQGMEELARRLEAARLEVEDIAAEVEQSCERVEVNPSRLEEVEQRLSLLWDLMHRHGVSTVEDLISEKDTLSGKVRDISTLEEREKELSKALEKASADYDAAASTLHKLRETASGGLSKAVEGAIHSLELDHAVFRVELLPAADGPLGRDRVDFLFGSTGKNPVEVQKAASGGELSRIMLAVKSIMAAYTQMPTMVFDEIDTGVSGSTADRMGEMICSMGERMQIFAITHLPQVAAKGRAHYLVSKKNDVTSMARLSSESRVMEIARMLSGSGISSAAIENAKALLG